MKKILIIFSVGALCVLASALSYFEDHDSNLALANVEALAGAETGVLVNCYNHISGNPDKGDHLIEARYCGDCWVLLCYTRDTPETCRIL